MKKIMIALLAAALTAMSAVSISAAEADTLQAVAAGESIPGQESFNGPRITGFENTADGTVVYWTAYQNAAKYRLFLWDGMTWRGLGNTESLSFTHKGLKSEQTYRYTVRALNKDGDFISDYWKAGDENIFLAPPVIESLETTETGVQVTWNALEGAEQYRVYRRTGNGGWRRVADTAETTLLDKNVPSGEKVWYTVRCINADASDWTSGYTSGKSIQFVKTPQITGLSLIHI